MAYRDMWILALDQREAHNSIIGLTNAEAVSYISSAIRSYRYCQAMDRVMPDAHFALDARANIRAMIDSARCLVFRPR